MTSELAGSPTLAAAGQRSLSPRVLQSRALAVMFGAGATMALVALALPHGAGVDALPWAVNASLGLPIAALLFVWGPRLADRHLHVLLGLGAAIVALGMSFGNGGTMSVAAGFFIVWVALYVFSFFEWRVAAAHLVWNALLVGIVLPVEGTPAAPSVWFLITGTAVIVGLVTGLTRQEMSRLAATDQLTGLPNRYRLSEVLEQETARAERTGEPFCIAVLDVDGLKAINDRLGHAAGDEALVAAAQAWRAALRPTDLLVRYGGDEFVVVLPGCSTAESSGVVGRLVAAASVECSVGLACWQAENTSDDVLRRADAALYAAKAQGRGRLVVDGA